MSTTSSARAAALPAAVDLFSKRDLMRNTGGAHQVSGYEFQATTGLSESLKHERNYHSTVGETGLQTDDGPKKDWGSTVIWRNDVKASEREAAEVRTLTKHDLQRGAKDFKPNSTVIAAVAQSKKTRHFEVLDEYDRCLNLIVEEMGKATLACVRTVKERLSSNKIEVQKLFDCMSDQFLTQLSQAQVEKVWSDFSDMLSQRLQCIHSFAATAESIEVARSKKVSDELRHVTDLLLDISYQNAGMVERLVEERAAALNLVLIDNRRAHADAVAKLRVHEIEYEPYAFLHCIFVTIWSGTSACGASTGRSGGRRGTRHFTTAPSAPALLPSTPASTRSHTSRHVTHSTHYTTHSL